MKKVFINLLHTEIGENLSLTMKLLKIEFQTVLKLTMTLLLQNGSEKQTNALFNYIF